MMESVAVIDWRSKVMISGDVVVGKFVSYPVVGGDINRVVREVIDAVFSQRGFEKVGGEWRMVAGGREARKQIKESISGAISEAERRLMDAGIRAVFVKFRY
jgi:isocitrate dehydrogenase